MAQSKDSRLRKIVCGYEYEQQAYAQGATAIAGLDEVGRGCIAAAVTAAACILPRDAYKIEGLRDSKLIAPKKRKRIAEEIKANAVAWKVAHVPADEIDRTNIAAATELAMYEAIHGLENAIPDFLLIDAVEIDIPIAQASIVNGDARCASIAAASIIAKVTRDEMMEQLAEQYPGYGFEQHKGYGTEAHIQALENLGPTPVHRMSFAPLHKFRGR